MIFSFHIPDDKVSRQLLQNLSNCCGGIANRYSHLAQSYIQILIDLENTSRDDPWMIMATHTKTSESSKLTLPVLRTALRIAASHRLHTRPRTDHIDSVAAALYERMVRDE